MKTIIRKQIFRKDNLILLLLIIFSLSAIWSLLYPGFFQSDDGEWMIIRFASFYQALKDGQFPVRFLATLNYGYGYPVANFLYPGFMYLGVPLKLIGFGFVDTIKIILVLSVTGSVLFCYLWLSKLFSRIPSAIGALIYIFAPYHLYDLYKRGSIGEMLALAVVPFVLWQFERRSLFWASVGIGFLILSHNTLAILFFGFFILYAGLKCFVSKERQRILKFYSSVFAFGFLMSSFFWLPAIFELQYTVFNNTSVSNWNEYFANLELIGSTNLLVTGFILYIFIVGKIKFSYYGLSMVFLLTGILSIFFATSYSSLFWSFLPVGFIQFPFRFLSISILCTSFLGALLISVFKSKSSMIIASFALSIIAISSSWNYIFPQERFDKGDLYYVTNQATTTVKDEYMPAWVDEKPITRFENKVEVIEGQSLIKDLNYNSRIIEFNSDSNGVSRVSVNTVYYPGWNAFIDNKNVQIDYKNVNGVMNLEIPDGIHTVKLEFRETILRLLADFLSLFSFIVLLFISFRYNVLQKLKSFRF